MSNASSPPKLQSLQLGHNLLSGDIHDALQATAGLRRVASLQINDNLIGGEMRSDTFFIAYCDTQECTSAIVTQETGFPHLALLIFVPQANSDLKANWRRT